MIALFTLSSVLCFNSFSGSSARVRERGVVCFIVTLGIIYQNVFNCLVLLR